MLVLPSAAQLVPYLLLLTAVTTTNAAALPTLNTTASTSHSTYTHLDPSQIHTLTNSSLSSQVPNDTTTDDNSVSASYSNDTTLGIGDAFDLVSCDPVYGDALLPDPCLDVLKNMYDYRIPRLLSVSRNTARPSSTNLQVPVEWRDRDVRPQCLVTIDLAGPIWSTSTVRLLSSKLREMVKRVVERCVQPGAYGGFTTHDLRTTGTDIRASRDRGRSFDAPSFLTLTITNPSTPNYRPGDTDPMIIQPLLDITNFWREQAWSQSAVDAQTLILNQLLYAEEGMYPSGKKTWWDDEGFRNMVPIGVEYQCERSLGILSGFERDCREASFKFIKAGDVTIKAGTGLEIESGECVFKVQTTTAEATIQWDGLRAVADILLGRCVEGNEAPGFGGMASGHDGPGPSTGYQWPPDIVVRLTRAGVRSFEGTGSVEEYGGVNGTTSGVAPVTTFATS